MKINERNTRNKRIVEMAQQIMTAARTAPKGRGVDIVEIMMITDEDIKTLSEKTESLGKELGFEFMLRDAENILSAEAIIIIGTRPQVQGLNCAYCGFATCAEKPNNIPCAINSVDVGIAIGSACSKAADMRIDNRVMFSVGLAAHKLGWLTDCQTVLAMPLSASSKNPFFDRKPKES